MGRAALRVEVRKAMVAAKAQVKEAARFIKCAQDRQVYSCDTHKVASGKDLKNRRTQYYLQSKVSPHDRVIIEVPWGDEVGRTHRFAEARIVSTSVTHEDAGGRTVFTTFQVLGSTLAKPTLDIAEVSGRGNLTVRTYKERDGRLKWVGTYARPEDLDAMRHPRYWGQPLGKQP